MTNKIITRFAPSPTGKLHIGGVRTALFNWLFAKHFGGKMFLRIEDTDKSRSSNHNTNTIIDDLKWVGLDWDGDIIIQSSRLQRHVQVADQMIKDGNAYYSYNEDSKNPVVRLKANNNGETIIEDLVQGTVKWNNKDIDDFVLLRSDGSPTYMLSVVVDDHDMGVTHIIRGVDHLTNAARQIQIYNAMGWDVPKMAHIPLIHGEDGKKLSKRDNDAGIEYYREMGYLPEALCNYLVRLGWSHGDQEIFSINELINLFNISNIGKSSACMNLSKLSHINSYHLRNMNDIDLINMIKKELSYFPKHSHILSWINFGGEQLLINALPFLKSQSKTLFDIIEKGSFLWYKSSINLNEDVKNFFTPQIKNILNFTINDLSNIDEWSVNFLDSYFKSIVEKYQLKLSQILPPIRIGLTGKTNSIPVSQILYILGREESLKRLKHSLYK